MEWDDYFQSLVQMEEENVAENFRPGRGVNAADEEANAEICRGFEELKAKLPVMLAAPELLAALKEVADGCEYRLRKGEDSGDRRTLRLCRAAIAKAEGRDHA